MAVHRQQFRSLWLSFPHLYEGNIYLDICVAFFSCTPVWERFALRRLIRTVILLQNALTTLWCSPVRGLLFGMVTRVKR